MLTATCEIAGLALMAVGLWMLAPWLSITVSGASLFLVACLRAYQAKGKQ